MAGIVEPIKMINLCHCNFWTVDNEELPVSLDKDVKVKIADLGNACWTVSLFMLTCHKVTLHILYDLKSIQLYRMILKVIKNI